MNGARRRCGGATNGRTGRREEGISLIIVALCLTVLTTSVAFTIDLGRISTTRRRLQTVADVAALDVARRLDGRTTAEIVAEGDLDLALKASLDRNQFDLVTPHTATMRIGHWNARTEVFTPTTGAEVPDAVQVEVADRIEYAFVPGGATTSRRGVAATRANTSFQIGSYAARVDSSTSPLLQPILGNILGVSVVSYEGLVGGRVRIDALLTELGLSIGSPDAVMGTTVGIAQLLAAEAKVLRGQGDLARADLLDQTILGLPSPNASVPLASLISLGAGVEEAAGSAHVDAFDLLTAAAFISNGDAFIDVPRTALGLGSLAFTSLQVRVIQKPVIVIGASIGDSASTSQVTIRLGVRGSVPGVADLVLDLVAEVAPATATVTDIACDAPERLDIDVVTGPADVSVPMTMTVRSTLPIVGSVPVANVAMHAASAPPSTTAAVHFRFPPDVLGNAQQVAGPGLGLAGATVTIDQVTALGAIPAGPVLNAVVGGAVSTVVNPLLVTLDATTMTPLLRALGTTIGGADVTPLAVGCNGTRLVG